MKKILSINIINNVSATGSRGDRDVTNDSRAVTVCVYLSCKTNVTAHVTLSDYYGTTRNTRSEEIDETTDFLK